LKKSPREPSGSDRQKEIAEPEDDGDREEGGRGHLKSEMARHHTTQEGVAPVRLMNAPNDVIGFMTEIEAAGKLLLV
jgi:hypothetical protein